MIIQLFKLKVDPKDEVPSCTHKIISGVLGAVLSILSNESIAPCSCPNFFKDTRVTTIDKSGAKFFYENYRTVPVRPFYNEVFERAQHLRTFKS